MRNPLVAGQFYSADPDDLKQEIDKAFQQGPGLSFKPRENEFIAGIAPHAGYVFSGKCASYLYKEIAESKIPDVYIILGTDHRHNDNKARLSLEDWETPLGIVKTDKEFGQSILDKDIIIDESSHEQEHSIEVQLPFLQYINKQEFKILPILVATSNIELCKKLAEKISESKGRKVAVIASSDFTHYGISYSFIPFTNNVKENLTKLDKKFIAYILDLNSKEFLEKVIKTETTICGYAPITTVIEFAKLKSAKAELLNYYTSGEISDDYSNCVGYASILFEK